MAFIRQTAVAALAAAALVPAALGQPAGYPTAPPAMPSPTPPPIHLQQPTQQTQCNGGVCLPPGAVSAPGPTAYPPAVYNPWGYPSSMTPAYGALTGAANLVNAQGQYQIQNQQSRIIQTQADMSRIDYRNALIQQEQYEKGLQPTTTEMRQQQQWQQLQSARNNPPAPEIWSGDALNALFTALQGAERTGLRADPVPIDPGVLQHINLTTGQASGAGAGMLKNVTEIDWPFAMQAPPWLSRATTINMLAQKAVDEVKAKGRVSAATFGQLNDAVSAMDNAVASNQTLSPTDYIESKGFLDDLQNSIQSLRDPNVAMYLNGGFSAKGPTVADLVAQMTSQGLHFAPATQNDQPSYTVLYQAMLAYDYRLSQLAHR
jgi:hypothetical protein